VTHDPTGADGATDPTWESWREVLVTAALGLGDGESVTVEAPQSAARMARGEPRRMPFLPPKRSLTRPWLRLTRVEDLLRGQCVGAEVFGGAFPWTAEEHAALVGLGWHASLADGPDYVRFWPDDVPGVPFLARSDAERAADVVAATLHEVVSPPREGADDPLPAILRA
jgi:hypothetical protein